MHTTAIHAVAEILFGADASPSVSVQLLYQLLSQYDQDAVDEVLNALRDEGLIKSAFDHSKVTPRVAGREAWQEGSLPALLIGDDYILEQSRDAVVHVIVETGTGEHGGTGFFCADYPGIIVTADHVVRDHRVLRIEGHRRNVISTSPLEVILGRDGIDIALICCACPADVRPLNIEWRQENTQAPLDVLVMGYPPVAGHHPALYQARGAVTSNPQDYALRRKLGLSDVTHPGCSGGPVISKRGFVVGIVEQENTLQQCDRTHIFRTATPAYYVREVMERSN
jgi:hypothetical protein